MTSVNSNPVFADVHVMTPQHVVRLGMERYAMDDGSYDYDIVNYTIDGDDSLHPASVFTEADWQNVEQCAHDEAMKLDAKKWSI